MSSVAATGRESAFIGMLRGSLRAQIVVGVLVLIVLVAIFAPVISPHDPNAQELSLRLKPPFWMEDSAPGYWLGTDQLGRDMLSRILYGSRV